MNRIRKKTPLPHLVVVDTNVLWSQDKAYVVSPLFDSFWDKYSKDFKIHLIIPEVVKGELLYQQSTLAIKAMKSAASELEKISKITEKKYLLKITETKIKNQAEKRFDKWLKDKKGKIHQTPINKIKWGELIINAIWREPPFVSDPQDRGNEKGFRDALILETLIDICYNEQSHINIVFISGDNLLREAAKKKLLSNERFDSYESIDSFESYLKLTREELEDQFIKALIRRASGKFYTKDDPNCLYLRDNVKNKLQDTYKAYFDNPEKSTAFAWGVTSKFSRTETWEPQDTGTFWLSPAQFIKVESGNEYYWVSKVTFVRQYRRSAYSLAHILYDIEMERVIDSERVLTLPFYVTWKAKITRDGRFLDLKLVRDELKDNSFQNPTDEQRKTWNLRIFEASKLRDEASPSTMK